MSTALLQLASGQVKPLELQLNPLNLIARTRGRGSRESSFLVEDSKMSILSVLDIPTDKHFSQLRLWELGKSPEKLASVSLSGLLQLTKGGQLIVAVPASLSRGLFDSMNEIGITMPQKLEGSAARSGILVMTEDEVQAVGADKITERGKAYNYRLNDIVSLPARNWPGVSTCWHMRVTSPELSRLRISYGLPRKLNGRDDMSIVIACRKIGVMTENNVSKATSDSLTNILPDWER